MDETSLRSDAAILGLDNVRLELPLAGVGSRSLAAVLDYVILVVLTALWWTVGLLLFGLSGIGTGWVIAVLTFGSFLVQWGYFGVLEIAMGGQTPGKSVLGLRVVSRHGGAAGAGSIVVRNLVRVVDLFCGLPLMAWDARFRRLGDLAAGTLVVHERPPAAGSEVRLGRLPPGFGGREIAVVESFLARAATMEPARAQALAEKLLRFFERTEPDFVAAAGETAVLRGLEPRTDRVALLGRLLQAEAA